MKATFLEYEKPLLTALVLCTTPEEYISKIKASEAEGADAFGLQLCKLKREYRTNDTLRDIFAACGGKPIYVTSYRADASAGFSDEECMDYLLQMADCDATLCDVMADCYCPTPGEITWDETAVRRQKELADELHRRGSEVLFSTHTDAYLTPEENLKIAMAQAERGADIVKIVHNTTSEDQMAECIESMNLIRKNVDKKFLYVVGGPCYKLIRQAGPNLGACMYLCVQSMGPMDAAVAPILKDIKLVRDHMIF